MEDDASIRLGCRDIRTNEQLLQAVRKKCPDAYIIYKPHPDVLSGNRKATNLANDPQVYNQLVTDISLPQCLDTVDEVHTMTSLVGFEGLLRDKSTVTYGLPFYSGWGITHDIYEIPERNKKLKIDELIIGCLIYYPRYFNHLRRHFTKPEEVVRLLDDQRKKLTSNKIKDGWLYRQARKIRHLINAVIFN